LIFGYIKIGKWAEEQIIIFQDTGIQNNIKKKAVKTDSFYEVI